jgi:DNA polymerase-3 subunit epsilon
MVELQVANRLANRLRSAGRNLSLEEATRAVLFASVVGEPERWLAPILDGRFRQEQGSIGLWEWHYPFPPLGEPLVVLDLETNGLDPVAGEIIEIAIMRVEGDQVTRFSQLVDPGAPLPPFISQLTGIQDSDLRDMPDALSALELALPYLEGGCWMIQNAPFDLGFILPRLARLGVKLEPGVVDTLVWARRALPKVRRRGLDELIRIFAIQCQSRHRAMADVEATYAVAREMYYMLTAGIPRGLLEV